MSIKFDIGDYVIQFESVLTVSEISHSFFQFLKAEYNSDNWEFILGLQTLESFTKKKNQKKVNKHFLFLVSNFLQPKSSKELFICPEEKKNVLKVVKKLKRNEWNLDESPLELLEPFRKTILVEYKNDAFKRFIRTENCLKLLEKHQNNRNVLLPRVSLIYSYSEEDFDSLEITENDVKFMVEYEKDNPNWSIVYNNKKKKITSYRSHWNYFPNLKFLTKTTANVKHELKIKGGFQETVLAFFKGFHKKFFSEYFILDYKYGDYFVGQVIAKIPIIFQKRVARFVSKFYYDPEIQQVVLRMKCSRFPNSTFTKSQTVMMKEKDGKERKVKAIPYFDFSSMRITRIDDETTLFEHITTFDILIPAATLGLEIRANQYYSEIYGALQKLGDKKKILDYKYELNELWEGLPVDPFGKMLWDLDIDGKDKLHKEKMEKRKKVFNISNYIIHFSSLKRKEINDVYMKFLNEEHNMDSWDFIVDYNSLKKLNEKSKFEDENNMIKKIMTTYIEPKSPKDLCISQEVIQELSERLEKRRKNYPSFKYFHKIYQDKKMEHQLDSFKRFVKLPEIQDILAKYQHDVDVMSPILGVLSSYENDDFSTTNVNSKDLNFVSSLTKNSSTWDSIFSANDFSISISKVNWFSKLSFFSDASLSSFEFECILPFGLQQVANGYLTLTKMNKIDSNISKAKFISQVNKTEKSREACLIESEMIWMWGNPMKKKNICTFIYYPNELVFISKPIQLENEKDTFNKYFEYQIISLTTLKDGSTKFQQIICLSSSEKVNWEKTMIERGNPFFISLFGSVESAKPSIVEMKEQYLEMKDGIPKDALGMMLYKMDLDSDENDFTGNSDTLVTETTFLDESESESCPSSPAIRYHHDRNSSFYDDLLIEI
eukprot:gene9597-1799_t